jgi:hypothetical protein
VIGRRHGTEGNWPADPAPQTEREQKPSTETDVSQEYGTESCRTAKLVELV